MNNDFFSRKNFLITSLLLLVLALVLNPYILGLCVNEKTFCYFDNLSHPIGKPLFYLALALFLTAVASFLFKAEAFTKWVRFGIVLIFVLGLIIFITPEYGGSGIVSIERDGVAFVLSILYFFVSIIVIAYKSWRLRGKSL